MLNYIILFPILQLISLVNYLLFYMSILCIAGMKDKKSSLSRKDSSTITVVRLFQILDKKEVKEIPLVLKGINLHLHSPSYGIKGKKMKFAGDELAKPSAVNSMKSYMEFLISKHSSNSQAADCYKALMTVYLCYTDVNLQFARKLGDLGVLSLLMRHITTMDATIYDTQVNINSVETLFSKDLERRGFCLDN